MDKSKQAPGGTARPNQNEFKGNPVNAIKPDDSGLHKGVKCNSHNRGKQGKG